MREASTAAMHLPRPRFVAAATACALLQLVAERKRWCSYADAPIRRPGRSSFTNTKQQVQQQRQHTHVQ